MTTVQVSVGLIGHLSEFLQLLPLDLRGPEFYSFVLELEERLNFQFCGNSTRQVQ